MKTSIGFHVRLGLQFKLSAINSLADLGVPPLSAGRCTVDIPSRHSEHAHVPRLLPMCQSAFSAQIGCAVYCPLHLNSLAAFKRRIPRASIIQSVLRHAAPVTLTVRLTACVKSVFNYIDMSVEGRGSRTSDFAVDLPKI